ncbi:MAG: diguanylate cyclase [Desulfurivibrionaceae bacterium]|jgi:diguanylate cyclase (GGDEF)-like protein/PAS domain S-box-containing protein
MRFNLLTGIFFLSIVAVSLLPISSIFFMVPHYEAVLTSITEEDAIRVAKHLADAVRNNGTSPNGITLQADYESVIEEVIKDFQIMKVKIFSKEGEIVFSTDHKEIGMTNTHDYFFDVVSKGKTLAKVVKKNTPSLDGQVQTAEIVEIYVPITKEGKILGAFEIYYNITQRKQRLDLVIRKYMATVFPVSIFLFVAVLIAVNKARQHMAQRQEAEAALQKTHNELEKRVEARTVELNRTNDELLKEIHKREAYEGELRLAAMVFENVIEGICITDATGTIKRVNKGFSAITGYTESEAVGRNPRILKSGKHPTKYYKEMWKTLLTTGQWHGKIWNRRKNGEIYQEWLSISSIKDTKNQTTHFVGLFYDISQLLKHQEQLAHKAYHDILTKLPNRELFFDQLQKKISNAKRHQKLLVVLFIDLDDFKIINDSLGHDFGDIFLQEVAKRLEFCCREEDSVGRFGGDEFVMALGEITDTYEIKLITDRIFEVFSDPVCHQEKDMEIKASIGAAIYPLDAEESADLVKKADLAMYQAKKMGKNKCQLYARP